VRLLTVASLFGSHPVPLTCYEQCIL